MLQGNPIAKKLGLRPAGVGLLLRRVLFLTVFIGGVTQVKSATNALYLSHRDPNGLAQLYLLVALSVAVVSYLLSKSLATRPPLVLLRRLGLLGSAVLFLLFMLCRQDINWAYGALYVFGEFYATMLNVLFWSDVSERFDLRAQKKVVGLLAAGGMFGTIIGGSLVGPLSALIGVNGLIALASLGLALAIVAMGRGNNPERRHPRSPDAPKNALRTLIRESYPRHIALLVTSLALLATLVDFHFRVQAASQLDEAGLASLFGQLNAAVGLGGILLQSLLTATILARYGVFVFLSMVPIAIFLLATANWIFASFALLVTLKGVEMIGSFSLYQPGVQLLYGPLHSARRHALRPLIDGAAKKIGVAISGLALIALAAMQLESIVIPMMLGVVLVVLLLLYALRRGFIETLDERLGGRRLHTRYAINPTDKITREALIRTLDSRQARDVLMALHALERWSGFDVRPYLQKLIVHPHELVRLAGIERAIRLDDKALLSDLKKMLTHDRRRVRVRAVRALAKLQPESALDGLRPYLQDKDPGVRLAVVAALLPLESSPQDPAHRVLSSLLEDKEHPVPLRRELARLMSELDGEVYIEPLRRLLHDVEPSVRRIACQSCVQKPRMALVEDLFYLLEDRAIRAEVRRALAAFGDELVPRLELLLNDRDAPLPQRLEMPRVLYAIATPAAANALIYSNIKDDATLRYRIAKNLFKMAQKNPGLHLDRARIDEAAKRRLRSYRYYRPVLNWLVQGKHPAYALLRRAVQDRLHQNLEMALRLIGLTRNKEMMLHIFNALSSSKSDMRAEAIELIDVALGGDPLRKILLRAIEDETLSDFSAEDAVRQLSSPQDALQHLSTSQDALLRALARHVAKSLHIQIPDAPQGEALDVRGADMDQPFIERVLLLEHVDLFANLSLDDLSALANIATERECSPGENVYREGERGDAMYVIAAGEIELIKGDKVIMTLRSGESIGQVSFMDGGPRPVGARVSSERSGASLLVIDRQLFMDLLADRIELVNGMFVVLAQRLRQLIDMTGPKAQKPPDLPPPDED